MHFPTFQVPYLGNGMIIGANAVIHVLISHGLAIGCFAMLLLGDWHALRGPGSQREDWGRLNKSLLEMIVLMTTIVGAVTGAGIWMTTTALAPAGITSMLRIFFWAWFVEWFAFFLEVVGILVLCVFWDRLATRPRLRIGLQTAYLGMVLSTAFLVTGILGFMLTPGDWLARRSFFSAFFNSSFVPQLISRLGLSFVLGSLVAMAFASFCPTDNTFRGVAIRMYGRVLLVASALFAISLVWYYFSIPPRCTLYADFAVLTSRLSQVPWLLYLANGVALVVILLIAILAWRRHTTAVRRLVVPGLVLFAGMVVEYERVREFIRGPFLMPWYMYANGVLLEEGPLLRREGAVASSPWSTAQTDPWNVHSVGAQLYSRQCSACHTIDGINSIRDRAMGRSEDGLFVILGRTQEMVAFMPQFFGTRDERRKLARFLYELSANRVEMDSLSRHTVSQGDDAR